MMWIRNVGGAASCAAPLDNLDRSRDVWLGRGPARLAAPAAVSGSRAIKRDARVLRVIRVLRSEPVRYRDMVAAVVVVTVADRSVV